MKKSIIFLVAISVAVMIMQGCAAKNETMSHGDIMGKTVDIATGDFMEACNQWKPGDTVKISFTTSKPVMFNVHYHAKHKKMYAVEQTMTDKFEGSFVVETDDIYCCMWQNNNDNYVTMTYDMSVEKQ
jgi:hypothetical protein